MSRVTVKTISSKPQKFIPKTHTEDPELNEANKEIEKRPLVVYWRKLTREDRYNISSLVETKDVNDEAMIKNLGSVARYVWDNCVLECCNVLLDDGAKESVKGSEKNKLFNTEGMDSEIAEIISHVQKHSSFDEEEAKN